MSNTKPKSTTGNALVVMREEAAMHELAVHNAIKLLEEDGYAVLSKDELPPALDPARPKYVSIKELASELCVSYKTVYKQLREGNIRGIRLGSRWLVTVEEAEKVKSRGASTAKNPGAQPLFCDSLRGRKGRQAR